MLEVEFLTLDPKSFDNLQDFFTKYKNFFSQLKACEVDKYKEEKQMFLTIISKIVLEYSVFVSKFNSVSLASRATWKNPSLEAFIKYSLTQEKTKLINMGNIKGSKEHALSMQYRISHQNHIYKHEEKVKGHANPKKEWYSKPFNNFSRSKVGNGRKGEKCTYFQRGFHLESTCM
jgi:hypothetical protein